MDYLIIGAGRFGVACGEKLLEEGHLVVCADKNMERLKIVQKNFTKVVQLDATDINALEEIEVSAYDYIIIAIGSDALQDSILTALNVINLREDNIIARSTSDDHTTILKRIGIQKIIELEKEAGRKLAMRLNNDKVIDYIALSDDIRLEEYIIKKKNKKLISKAMSKLKLRENYDINIICIKRDKDIIIPAPEIELSEGDIILVVGENEKLDLFREKI